MFEPGQKVVCIDGAFPPDISEFYDAIPVKDAVYTVRDIVPGIQWNGAETISVYLVELVNTPNLHGFEPGFACSRFREVEETDAEVSAATQLVTQPA
jgi:hypothetical protein